MPGGQTTRQHWLWVTRPKYYLDDEGNERADLDPGVADDAGGWWTCHRDTRMGDLVFLWRTRPKSDIGYLIEAKSNAYSLEDDPDAVAEGWDFACEYEVLYKFDHPVTFKDLKADPVLANWGTVRGQMQGRVFQVPPPYWEALNHLALQKNPRYGKFLGHAEQQPVLPGILVERELEDRLARNLGVLKPLGYDLRLYVEPGTQRSGRQFVCKGNGGRIDLLCYDQKGQRYVVIELKNVQAGQNTFGQISNYVGWVQTNIARRTPVIGLVISRGADAKFQACLQVTDRIKQFNINQLQLG